MNISRTYLILLLSPIFIAVLGKPSAANCTYERYASTDASQLYVGCFSQPPYSLPPEYSRFFGLGLFDCNTHQFIENVNGGIAQKSCNADQWQAVADGNIVALSYGCGVVRFVH